MADRNVYFAKITRELDLWAATQSFREAIVAALDPDQPVIRYRKTWHVSRHAELDEGEIIAGKLGSSGRPLAAPQHGIREVRTS